MEKIPLQFGVSNMETLHRSAAWRFLLHVPGRRVTGPYMHMLPYMHMHAHTHMQQCAMHAVLQGSLPGRHNPITVGEM